MLNRWFQLWQEAAPARQTLRAPLFRGFGTVLDEGVQKLRGSTAAFLTWSVALRSVLVLMLAANRMKPLVAEGW